MVSCAVLAQSVLVSAFRLFERKNTIHAKTEIADILVAQHLSGARNTTRLFFPFSDPYPIAEFASYLTYRGVPVEESATDRAMPGYGVALVANVSKDGPCVTFTSFVCHTASWPRVGDLVIELPDDDESLVEIEPFRRGGETLLSYQPHPNIPAWLHPFVNRLRAASVRFEYRDLPDRWMHASVTAWK